MINQIKKELYLAELDCIEGELHELIYEMDKIKVEMEIKGCLVFKYIKCGRTHCQCRDEISLHGPYPHLQSWEGGKIKTKYLNRKIYPIYRKELDKIKRKKEILKSIAELKKREKKLKKQILLL